MDEEEGDFMFNASSRSRLSSLFQAESSREDVNDALTFTAPKQPKKSVSEGSNSSETMKLLHAGVVQAYKLIKGNYVEQGKVGCAIVGAHETARYRILLYKGKQDQITFCNISPSFKFHVQPNNYANFYDITNENWSINFASQAALIDFAKQVALAIANSEGQSQRSLVVQDLVPGEGPELESGDSADVQYTGWSFSNFGFGQQFDSNVQSGSPLRVRLGKSKFNKGFSDGLLGAQKNCRRLLVVPSNLAGKGTAPSMPSNSAAVFDILVSKVKIARDTSHSPSPLKVQESVPEKKPEVVPRASFSQEDNIRLRGASISEQLSQSPRKDRAELISRMAKMGTATLPFTGAVVAQVSGGSEDEENLPEEQHSTHSISGRVSPEVPAQVTHISTVQQPSQPPTSILQQPLQATTTPVQQHPQPPPHRLSVQESVPFQVAQHSSQIALYSQATLPAQQAFVTPTSSFPGYGAPYPMAPFGGMVAPSDAHLSLLASEVRGQSAEVRLSLARIADKVDSVAQTVDEIRGEKYRVDRPSSSSFLDAPTLFQSIERIVQENNNFKSELEDKNSKIETLNKKVYDLVERNQRFFEERNSILEQKSDNFQAVSAMSQVKISTLEEEKSKLSSELSAATARLNSLESELLQLQKSQDEKEKAEIALKDSTSEKESNLLDRLAQMEQEKIVVETELKDTQTKYKELLESSSTAQKTTTSEAEEVDRLREENKTLRLERTRQISEMEKIQSDLQALLEKETLLKKNVQDLKSELDSSLLWKKKLEVFHERTRILKETYESRIEELQVEKRKRLASATAPTASDFSAELKRVMNALYKILQSKFESSSSYSGTEALEVALQSIKALTFQMLEKKSQSPSPANQQASTAAEADVPPVPETVDVSASKASEESVTNNVQQTHPEVTENGDSESKTNDDSVALTEPSSTTKESDASTAHLKKTEADSSSDSPDPVFDLSSMNGSLPESQGGTE